MNPPNHLFVFLKFSGWLHKSKAFIVVASLLWNSPLCKVHFVTPLFDLLFFCHCLIGIVVSLVDAIFTLLFDERGFLAIVYFWFDVYFSQHVCHRESHFEPPLWWKCSNKCMLLLYWLAIFSPPSSTLKNLVSVMFYSSDFHSTLISFSK